MDINHFVRYAFMQDRGREILSYENFDVNKLRSFNLLQMQDMSARHFYDTFFVGKITEENIVNQNLQV